MSRYLGCRVCSVPPRRALLLARALAVASALTPVYVPGAASAAARLAEPLAPAVIDARLVGMASPVDLTVETGGQPWRVSVRGVRDDPVCQPDQRLAWARSVLPAGTQVHLGAADRWGARSVRFDWQGRALDWAFVLLRAGQAFPGGSPDEPARLPEAYAWAAREARAEGRGLWGECGRALQRFRRVTEASGIPAELLWAIAMTESGVRGAPWPWTLNVAGRPLHFASRASAWQALERLQAAGERRIDIGLMQVNWGWHGARFQGAWQALDPDVNQAVAAGILREEWRRSGNLAVAVARYHSADPVQGQAYLERVLRFLRSLPGGSASTPKVLRPSDQPKGRDAHGNGP